MTRSHTGLSPNYEEDHTNRVPNGYPSEPTFVGIEKDALEPIAIVGFSARLPQDGETSEGFWRMLYEGRSAASAIPKDRFNVDAFYHHDVDRIDTMHVKSVNFLRGDVAAFDAPFFSIQPSEVASMDPQQRCMLEASFRAFENAGIPIESVVASKTCVFVGNSARDYEALLLRDPEMPAKYVGTGIGTSMLANRVSWFYDLRGPSIALDTACSSSLSALHLACQSLRDHESCMGLVGGCNLILAPDVSIIPLTNMGFFSPDGKCFSFDHRANGYAKGEGAGLIVIKLLADAIKDGDTIRAVIRATGANQDGKTPGLTQPSERAQEENIRETYNKGGLDMNVTKHFEAHGTGTQIGDPIEAAAINAAFQRTSENPLYIGAVKPNIGHLEAASSIAGLIKSVMILEKGVIPPNINFEKPNVKIPVEKWHLKFPLEPTPFPTSGLRRISINSFGYGGSNTHAVLDDAFNYMKSRDINGKHNTQPLPPTRKSLCKSSDTSKEILTNGTAPHDGHTAGTRTEQPRVLTFSASDEDGLARLANTFQAHFSTMSEFRGDDQGKCLNNLSYTLSNKRSSHPWKSFVLAYSIEELESGLLSKMSKPVRSSTGPALSFVFTGQGAQWCGMGRELFVYEVFRRSLFRSQDVLRGLDCRWNLIDKLQLEENSSAIDNPGLAQPLCTALQIAVVDLLASWDMFPTAVAGHSSGEIAAAYCAGSISHESAMEIVYYRGLLAARLEERQSSQGTMASIGLSETAILPFLSEVNDGSKLGQVEIGCINSPNNITITGDKGGVIAMITLMEKKGIFARRLPVNVAYHSGFMQEIAEEYSTLIRDIAPRIVSSGAEYPVVFSSISGAMVQPGRMTQPEYWVTNLVSKVKFSEALGQMALYLLEGRATSGRRKDLLVEIGPSSALQRPVKDTVKSVAESGNITYDSVLKRGVSATKSCLELMGRLWTNGYKVNFAPINCPTVSESELQLLVDLPEYPFNHTNSYWTESRISKNFRMRQHARHDLLGATIADWNPLEPRWRNIIRVQENPWIVDHVIQGSELYPAAGMIIMAIEGMRQITNAERIISGYRVENLSINRALMVTSAAEGVECQMHFRGRKGTMSRGSGSNDFTLYAYSNGEWASICEGSITVDFEEHEIEIGSGQKQISKLKTGFDNCKEAVNSKQFYRNLASFGFGFGPTFQALSHIQYNEFGEASATIRLDGWKEKVDDILSSDCVIHPTALDGILHLTMAAASKGSWESIPTYVPTQAKSLWISNDLLTRAPKSEIKVYTKKTFQGYREADFWIAATNAEDKLMVVVEGWRMTALSSSKSGSGNMSGLQCHHIEWKPDPDLMATSQIVRYCEYGVDSKDLLAPALVDQWELVCLLFMSKTAEVVPQYEGLAPHLQKYLEWTKFRFSQSRLNDLLSVEEHCAMVNEEGTSREDFLTSFADSSPEGALHVTVGRNIERVLKGEVDGLDLLFSTSLVQKFYHSPSFGVSYRRIAAYVGLLAHKNPNLRILEIGAGTGAATNLILRSLWPDAEDDGIPRFSQYTYTDISPAFFEDAKSRFKPYLDRMTFSVLDIEKDPQDQGFEESQYDLIICGLVLHATADLNNTLQNTRKLTKSSGKLVMFEPSNPEATRVSFVFGLLPGWWLGTEEKRKQGPLLSDSDWHRVLLENGFSGAEIALPDYRDERHTFSAIISTALDVEEEIMPPRRTVIVTGPSDLKQNDIAEQLKQLLESTAKSSIDIYGVRDLLIKDVKGTTCIFLLEIEAPFLVAMSDDDFAALKVVTSSTDGVLWVTQGCGDRASRPERGLVTGFGRNMGSENLNIPFVELAVEDDASASQIVNFVVRVFDESFSPGGALKETEYTQRDDSLCLSRVVKCSSLSHTISAKTTRQEPELIPFQSDLQRALTLSVESPGQLDTLYFKDDELFDVPLAPLDIEIKVHAAGLGLMDVKIALGQLPGNTLGSECAGIVTRVGQNVESLQPGDRVCCCAPNGAFNTYVRTQATATIKIPEDLSYSSAAALPVAFGVGFYALLHWARLGEGESILIYNAADSIGQAAVQIAKLLQADIFVTVDTEEKKRLLLEAYGLEADHVFHPAHTVSTSALMQTTNGMDVVLSLADTGEGVEPWSSVKPFGRFIELGKSDAQSRAGQPPQSVSFISFGLDLFMAADSPILRTSMETLGQFLTTGRITPCQPLHVHRISEVEQAFRNVQSENFMGKVIVDMQDAGTVPILPSTKPSYFFDPNATYVISGGLGGLGRSIVRWMVDRKARHFVLLSRSGAKDAAAIDLIEEMKLRHVKIATPPCDISVEDAVLKTLEECKRTMPPIKGCIQASMVLKDGLFENMSLSDFNASIRPKVQGSYNLHTHLPQNLDFYLLLSSITGITGSRGQRNYACGNTYQNALARHRVSLGQKCISLDLGSILSIGFAAEKDLNAALEKDGFQGIRKAEFFALLDYCCDPALPVQDSKTCQIITGLGGIQNMSAERMQEVYWTRKPLFSILRQQNRSTAPASTDASASAVDYGHLVKTAASQAAAETVVVQALKKKLAAGLSIPVEDVDEEKAIHSFGIDSLVALEVRYWFGKEMKADVTIFDIMQSQSVHALGRFAAGKSEYRQAATGGEETKG